MKHILTIQDLSCLGKCSLTVALPILSTLGCTCSVLPTAVLSTHTAFPDPHVRDLTEDILPNARHWAAIGARFDAISIGYLSNPEQAQTVMEVLDLFDCPVILDPVMGDHGKLYSRMTSANVDAMKQLCRKADYVLPNLTEAALLTDLPYCPQPDDAYLAQLTDGLLAFGVKAAVITGISWDDQTTGFAGSHAEAGPFVYKADKLPGSQHGTGDMFSAVFSGCILSGKTVQSSAETAARFVEQVISATAERSPFGARFEAQLPWLWQQL